MSDERRKSGGRQTMARVYYIHEAVRSGGYPNCSQIAEHFAVSRKTIQRDVDFMRDELRLPLEYESSQHGYYYGSPVDDFPIFDFTSSDLAALFLTKQALSQVRGTSLAKSLGESMNKLSQVLDGKVSLSWSELDEAFSVKQSGVVDADLKLFGMIAEAVLQQREIRFSYRKMGAKQLEKRQLHPYHVGEIEGGWYVIGYDPMREGIRTFALQRMVGARALKKSFERPADFHIGEYLSGSLGIWSTQNQQPQLDAEEVVIHCRDWVARVVQERRWHPTQKTKVLDDHGDLVELRMRLDSLQDVMRLVLSWGRNAKVKAPRKLQMMVTRELKAMQQKW